MSDIRTRTNAYGEDAGGTATAVKKKSRGFIHTMHAAYMLLNVGERRTLPLMGIAIILNALLQTAALVVVVPLVRFIIDPAAMVSSRLMQVVVMVLSIESVDRLFVIFCIFVLAIVAAKNLFSWWQVRVLANFTARCEGRLARDLLERTLRAPYAWTLTRNTAVLREIIQGHTVQWSRRLVRGGLQLVSDIIFAALVAAALVAASPAAGLVAGAIAAVLAGGLFRVTRPVLSRLAEEKRSSAREATLACTEALGGAKDVRMANATGFFLNSFTRHFQRYADADGRSIQWRNLPKYGIEIVSYVTLVTIALTALAEEQSRADVAGLLALYAMAALRLLPVVASIVTTVGSMIDVAPEVAEIVELRQNCQDAEKQSVDRPFEGWQKLSAENVSYAYPKVEAGAIVDMSVSIKRGKAYGVVGTSGAGKTTLVDILIGLLSPDTGRIKVDAIEIVDSNRAAWRLKIGYVSQTPFLIDDTLAANITLGVDPSQIDYPRLEAVVRAAALDDFVSSHPDGLKVRVGERGGRISGGQRQRVAIARALYRDVEILVLDEATSALDSLSEREIMNALHNLRGRVTVVVVAHRLSTVVSCDEIWLIDEGRLASSGTHTSLFDESSLYRAMANAQGLAT